VFLPISLSAIYCTVPLTATAADLVEKVVWLKQNQDMAKTLAANARNFAASYLRLEDYHCYIATLLEKLPEVSVALYYLDISCLACWTVLMSVGSYIL
jgi:hypothetical protein